MAKFHRPKLNNWLSTLVLASLGLHGLVLALPMPDLAEPPPEPPELSDPDVIQVVTLPKLATAPESPESPLPPPPEEEEEPPPPSPEEEIVITDPEILAEVTPDIPDEIPPEDNEPEPPTTPSGDGESGDTTGQSELDKQLKERTNYSNFSQEKAGDSYREGGNNFNGAISEWMGRKIASDPNAYKTTRLESIEAELPPVESLACLGNPPSGWVSVIVQVSATDGSLIGQPELLNSSGYEILDKKALEIAANANHSTYYNPDDPAPGYWFNVRVNYDPC
ncbi:MAG: hypothetical protein AAF243_05170 [Cyanobacteria bacterium P01_A01_bin.137]